MTPRRSFKLEAAALLAFLAASALAFGYMWAFAGGDLNRTSRPYRVQAVVPTAVALAGHADVRQAGVKIGEVAEIANRGDQAVLLLELDDEHAPAYRDARVLVRTKTLSGENYVDLDPGSPAAGRVPDGGVLSIGHAGQAVQLDQVLSTFDRRSRRDLQRVLAALGQGLDGHGADLNRFLEGSAGLIRDGRSVSETLAADRARVASLIDDFGRVMGALGDRKDAIRLMTRRSQELAEAVAARDEQLRETIAELPGFLRQTRGTSDRLGAFAVDATPVMRDLRLGTGELVPAMELLRPASARARRAMRALDGFTRQANPLVEHLRPFARASARLTPPLERLLRQVNPLQAYLAPYWRDFGSHISTLRGGSDTYDALGHYSHTEALLSRSMFTGLSTPAQQQAVEDLLDSGALAAVDTIGLNPYPSPGSADRPEPFAGRYPRLEADPPYSSRGGEGRG